MPATKVNQSTLYEIVGPNHKVVAMVTSIDDIYGRPTKLCMRLLTRRIQHYCKIHGEEQRQKKIIKMRHNVLLMVSSENFAVPLYTQLKRCWTLTARTIKDSIPPFCIPSLFLMTVVARNSLEMHAKKIFIFLQLNTPDE